jgi:hypothetical protein
MRLNIYDQFVVGVVRPGGGWSKGRPIAYVEESDRCVPLLDLLVPNDLDDEAAARYVGERFGAFAQPGKRVEALTEDRHVSRETSARRLNSRGRRAHSG